MGYWLLLYESASSLLKRRDIHHTAEMATSIYTVLLRRLPAPPKSHATRSNSKIPTSPQFIPPTIRRISASLSHILRTPLYSGFLATMFIDGLCRPQNLTSDSIMTPKIIYIHFFDLKTKKRLCHVTESNDVYV